MLGLTVSVPNNRAPKDPSSSSRYHYCQNYPWNGQDAQAIEEEFSLEDIMADDDELANDGQTGEL